MEHREVNPHKENDGKLGKLISRISLVVLIGFAVAGYFMYRAGLFDSVENIQKTVKETGIAGEFLFFVIQIVQVVIPIIPGGISCLAGVILFGVWKGFVINYLGICLGSCIAFAISKYFGRDLMTRLFSDKIMQKYEKWTGTKSNFLKLFAIAIFLPVAPDDFLCYLAGTTGMRWKHFLLVIFSGKPTAIGAYSLVLYFFANNLFGLTLG